MLPIIKGKSIKLILSIFICLLFHTISFAQYQNLALLPTSGKVSIDNNFNSICVNVDLKAPINENYNFARNSNININFGNKSMNLIEALKRKLILITATTYHTVKFSITEKAKSSGLKSENITIEINEPTIISHKEEDLSNDNFELITDFFKKDKTSYRIDNIKHLENLQKKYWHHDMLIKTNFLKKGGDIDKALINFKNEFKVNQIEEVRLKYEWLKKLGFYKKERLSKKDLEEAEKKFKEDFPLENLISFFKSYTSLKELGYYKNNEFSKLDYEIANSNFDKDFPENVVDYVYSDYLVLKELGYIKNKITFSKKEFDKAIIELKKDFPNKLISKITNDIEFIEMELKIPNEYKLKPISLKKKLITRYKDDTYDFITYYYFRYGNYLESLYVDKYKEINGIKEELSFFKLSLIKNSEQWKTLMQKVKNDLLKEEKKARKKISIYNRIREERILKKINQQQKLYNDEFKNIKENIFHQNITSNIKTYYTSNNSKLLKWTIDQQNKISNTDITTLDIEAIENDHFARIETDFNNKIDNTHYLSIGSINTENKKVKFTLNGKITTVDLKTSNSYDGILNLVSKKIDELPKKSNIVIARDALQLKFELNDKKSDTHFGDKYLDELRFKDLKWVNHSEFARQLKLKNLDKRFIISSTKDDELSKIKNINNIKKESDIIAYLSPESFDIEKDLLKFINKSKRKKRITSIKIDPSINNLPLPSTIKQSNVIVISAHKNSKFETYLKFLAENGYFKGKDVVLFSCNERGTTSLNSYLIEKGGANQIMYFPSRLYGKSALQVLEQIAKIIKSRSFPKEGLSFEELLKQAIDDILKGYLKKVPKPNSEEEKKYKYILEMKLFLKQITEIINLKKLNYG